MLSKKFRLYVTPAQRKEFLRVFKQEFNRREFLTFVRKFRGSMIFRGKNSLSYKLFDSIRIRFKKAFRIDKNKPQYKKKRRKIVFYAAFKRAISNLIPILGISNVKRGRKVETIPVLLKLRKKIVLINKWLISNQKNKSNVRGIKINDVSRLILLSLLLKGNAYDQKVDYLKKAYAAKHILLKMRGRRFNKKAFRSYQNEVLKKLEEKYGVFKKTEKIESHSEAIESVVETFLFLKYRRKNRKVKKILKEFREYLLYYWPNRDIDHRWVYFMEWVYGKFTPESKLKFKNKISLLRKKYKYRWSQEREKLM